ncbi:hypothetical protein [Citrobacter meridianamericanus]
MQLGIIGDEDKESLIGWVQYIKAVQTCAEYQLASQTRIGTFGDRVR